MGMYYSGDRQGGASSFSGVMANLFHREAPFLDLLERRGKNGLRSNGEVQKGHEWDCDDVTYVGKKNAKSPAGCEVNPDYTPPTLYKNEFQTFSKDSSLADETKAEAGCRSNAEKMSSIQMRKRRELAQDREYALMLDTPPVASADKQTPREMAGLKHYVAAANKVDKGGAAIAPHKDITAAIKKLVTAGVKGTFVALCGADVYEDVIEEYNDKLQIKTGETKGGVKVKEIITGFGDVEIMTLLTLAPDEFIIITLEYIGIVKHREYKGKDVGSKACDSETRQDLIQETLQVCPTSVVQYVNVGRKA